MKALPFLLLSLSLIGGATSHVRSQVAAPAQTVLQQLQAMRSQNQQLLDKQTATITKLDELQLQAQQLKFFGKRS